MISLFCHLRLAGQYCMILPHYLEGFVLIHAISTHSHKIGHGECITGLRLRIAFKFAYIRNPDLIYFIKQKLSNKLIFSRTMPSSRSQLKPARNMRKTHLRLFTGRTHSQLVSIDYFQMNPERPCQTSRYIHRRSVTQETSRARSKA